MDKLKKIIIGSGYSILCVIIGFIAIALGWLAVISLIIIMAKIISFIFGTWFFYIAYAFFGLLTLAILLVVGGSILDSKK